MCPCDWGRFLLSPPSLIERLKGMGVHGEFIERALGPRKVFRTALEQKTGDLSIKIESIRVGIAPVGLERRREPLDRGGVAHLADGDHGSAGSVDREGPVAVVPGPRGLIDPKAPGL